VQGYAYAARRAAAGMAAALGEAETARRHEAAAEACATASTGNALIAPGLARYGFKAETARIFDALFHASIYIDLRRLPELFCGFARSRGQGPTFYPVACSPQACAAAATIALISG
jgi:hypothetical protein